MSANIRESYPFRNLFNYRFYTQLLLPCFLTHSIEFYKAAFRTGGQ